MPRSASILILPKPWGEESHPVSNLLGASAVTMESKASTCGGDGLLEGRYANYFEIGHNAFEFLLDLGQAYEEGEKVQIHTRVITNPKSAQRLCKLLGESIDRYERTFGVIPND